MAKKKKTGEIGWLDLTIRDAGRVRDFYAKVVGWKPGAVGMGGYDDYIMTPPKSRVPAAGVCHARGANKGLPKVWLVYVVVKDLRKSLAAVRRLKGKVLRPPTGAGGQGRYAVIQDPAGAIIGLFEYA